MKSKQNWLRTSFPPRTKVKANFDPLLFLEKASSSSTLARAHVWMKLCIFLAFLGLRFEGKEAMHKRTSLRFKLWGPTKCILKGKERREKKREHSLIYFYFVKKECHVYDFTSDTHILDELKTKNSTQYIYYLWIDCFRVVPGTSVPAGKVQE